MKLVGVKKPEQVTVVADGSAEFKMVYEEHTATAVIRLSEIDITEGVTIHYRSEGELLYDNANVRKRIFDILLHAQMSYYAKSAIWNHIQDGNHVGFNDVCTAPEYTSLLGAIEELLALERMDV